MYIYIYIYMRAKSEFVFHSLLQLPTQKNAYDLTTFRPFLLLRLLLTVRRSDDTGPHAD